MDKEIWREKYDRVDIFCNEDVARVELNGKYGFVDKTGREVIPLIYDWAENFSNGQAKVKRNGKDSFIDRTGQEIHI
jgi:hypothetical protein